MQHNTGHVKSERVTKKRTHSEQVDIQEKNRDKTLRIRRKKRISKEKNSGERERNKPIIRRNISRRFFLESLSKPCQSPEGITDSRGETLAGSDSPTGRGLRLESCGRGQPNVKDHTMSLHANTVSCYAESQLRQHRDRHGGTKVRDTIPECIGFKTVNQQRCQDPSRGVKPPGLDTRTSLKSTESDCEGHFYDSHLACQGCQDPIRNYRGCVSVCARSSARASTIVRSNPLTPLTPLRNRRYNPPICRYGVKPGGLTPLDTPFTLAAVWGGDCV
jgi:hypothetical protein